MFNNYAKKISRSIFNLKEGTELKIFTRNQMLKRLLIAVAQMKAGSNSKSLCNEIRQIVYSLYRSKKLLKRYTTA